MTTAVLHTSMAYRSPPIAPQGGFDCDFVEPPPNRLCCGICSHPVRDPLLTSCRHSFCSSCLGGRSQIPTRCPVCNEPYTIFADVEIAREVKILRVRCCERKAGCEWIGEVGKIEEHVVNCGYATLPCTKCGQLMQRRLMKNHQDLLCPHRKYDCYYCRVYVNTYEDVTKNHWPICAFFPVPCPNDCPNGSIPRNRLMDHIKSECRVKKDGKELAAVKLQNVNLQEKLYVLRENEERQDARIKELEKHEHEMATTMNEMQEELCVKDKKIFEVEVELKKVHRKLHQQQQQQQQQRGVEGACGGTSVLDRASMLNRRPRGNEGPFVQTVQYPLAHSPGGNQPIQEQGQFVQTVQYPLAHSPSGSQPVLEQPNLMHDSNISLQWKQTDCLLPQAMYSGHAVLVGNFVYAGGGICQKKDSEYVVFKYDYRNETWCSLPTVNRKGFAMVSFKNQLVLIGGATVRAGERNIYLQDLIVWNEMQHRWDQACYPPMNTARMYSTAVAHEICIAVAGGLSAHPLDVVEVFDNDRREWHTKACLPVKACCTTSAFVASEAAWYIMGGNGLKKSGYVATLNQLMLSNEQTPTTDVWKPLPDARYTNTTVAAFGKSILSIGGKSALGTVNEVFAHFPGMRIWLRVEKLPRSFYGCMAVIIPSNELLLIGGCSSIDWSKHLYKGVLKRGL